MVVLFNQPISGYYSRLGRPGPSQVAQRTMEIAGTTYFYRTRCLPCHPTNSVNANHICLSLFSTRNGIHYTVTQTLTKGHIRTHTHSAFVQLVFIGLYPQPSSIIGKDAVWVVVDRDAIFHYSTALDLLHRLQWSVTSNKVHTKINSLQKLTVVTCIDTIYLP